MLSLVDTRDNANGLGMSSPSYENPIYRALDLGLLSAPVDSKKKSMASPLPSLVSPRPVSHTCMTSRENCALVAMSDACAPFARNHH
jgi:hypothetical protein